MVVMSFGWKFSYRVRVCPVMSISVRFGSGVAAIGCLNWKKLRANTSASVRRPVGDPPPYFWSVCAA